MLIIIAIHEDGDILAQKRLSEKTVEILDNYSYGCKLEHVNHSIDDYTFEFDLDAEEMPKELIDFIDKYENVKYFALDDHFHDYTKDFNETEWFNRAYPYNKRRKK
jgi:hypothetical protein